MTTVKSEMFNALIIYTSSLSEYSCALQCDILVHGRLYLSKNYACFYANILTWEKSVS